MYNTFIFNFFFVSEKFSVVHPFCLEGENNTCQKCLDQFERQPQPQQVKETNQATIMYSITMMGVLLVWDLISCVSIDKVTREELNNTIEGEYIWLPVSSSNAKFYFY